MLSLEPKYDTGGIEKGNMILTDHFKLRIVQRIIGIKNKKKQRHNISKNEAEVIAKSIELIIGSRILHDRFHPAIRR
ncbi:hypothetical protein [Peribacillus sp. NPDC096448]|uniref:hypothetical protein n=1 Tax=Peribacillus sp. NPDC096448 TaxID=3364395 RepID=UPI0037F7DDDC